MSAATSATPSAAPVAVVTGGSSGIGRAVARALHARGHVVYAVARRPGRMADLEADGLRVRAVDVTDDASMVRLVEEVVAETGRIDVLVNNAGYGAYGAVEDVPPDEARRQFEVNLFGAGRLVQLVVPHMRARRSGRIINVSSIGGKIYEPLGAWYHATKFAVEGFSDCLRLELAPHGIQVVVVEPGATATEWASIAVDGLLETSGGTAYAAQAEHLADMLHDAHTGRMVSPPEVVARAVVRAVQARRPRTRVPVAGNAPLILALRRVLPDRAADLALTLVFARMARRGRRHRRAAAGAATGPADAGRGGAGDGSSSTTSP